jgi:4-hydroxy-2-oxoheptanedioate aldolase
MNNKVKGKLSQNQVVLGTFVWSAADAIVESLGYTGLDFVVIDSEHSPVDTEQAIGLIRIAQSKGLTAFVRVKDGTRTSILKMLDAGADGLVIPCLRTVDEVREIIEHGKYAPLGKRGFALARRSGYGFEPLAADLQQYFAVNNAETLLLPMCETEEFLEQIEEIVGLEGVDGIFVGPFDLSVALGKPGQFNTPEFQAALRRIVQACQAAAKPAFIFAANSGIAVEHARNGYRGIALSTDVQTLIQAYRQNLAQVKEAGI